MLYLDDYPPEMLGVLCEDVMVYYNIYTLLARYNKVLGRQALTAGGATLCNGPYYTQQQCRALQTRVE